MEITDNELKEIFMKFKNVATVGFSKDPSKWAGFVPRFLISKGYNVIPVNPMADEIEGRKSYHQLSEVPEQVEIVQVFRPSEEVPGIVNQAIGMNVKVIWLQKGIVSEEAEKIAESHGITFLQDLCMYEEYTRLFGP
ncbi:MAG: CoA-binding protein [Nitrososphaeria archaeon]